MVYIVTEGKIVEFPDATVAKISGNGQVIHIIRDDTIIGNFPAKHVAYYGIELPPRYAKQYEHQKAWEALPPEERAKISAEAKRLRGVSPEKADDRGEPHGGS